MDIGLCPRTLRASLDSMKTKWYHSVFIILHPNRVGPTNDHLFGLVLDYCFHDSNTQNFGFGWWKMKTRFWCFQFLRIELEWHDGNFPHMLAPTIRVFILWVSRVFWSFFGVRRYFGNFWVSGIFLVIFEFRGYFGHFLGFGVILVIFGFRGYFGHFWRF